jgi:glycosyltransferase involved in cell wall biosynthesis
MILMRKKFLHSREKEVSSCRLRIAWVEIIRTLSSGGRIHSSDRTLPPIEARLSKTFAITFLRYPSIREYIGFLHLLQHQLRFSIRNAFYLLTHDYDLLVLTGIIPNIEGFVPFVIGKLMRKPVLLKETHWYWPNTFRAKVAWPINLWLVNRATLVIVPGKRVLGYWRQVDINPDKIRMVAFYSNLLEMDRHVISLTNTLRTEFRDRVIVAYFGRLLKKKGVDYLIRAFAKIKSEFSNTVLIIGGNGPERSSLERLSESLGVREVKFLGAVSERDKPAFFMASDIYVCPSVNLGTPEEWGMVVTEAMSVGKPVVVTNATGGSLDLVENGVNGYVVPEKDPDSLYKAIKNLVENQSLRSSMGEASKRMVNRFGYDSVTQAMIQAIILAVRRNSPHKD